MGGGGIVGSESGENVVECVRLGIGKSLEQRFVAFAIEDALTLSEVRDVPASLRPTFPLRAKDLHFTQERSRSSEAPLLPENNRCRNRLPPLQTFSSRSCFSGPTRSAQMRVLPLTTVGGLLRDSRPSTHFHRQHSHISLVQNPDHQLNGKALPSPAMSLHSGWIRRKLILNMHQKRGTRHC